MDNSATETLIGGIILLSLSGLGTLIYKKQFVGMIATCIIAIAVCIIASIKFIYHIGMSSMYYKCSEAMIETDYPRTNESIETAKLMRLATKKIMDGKSETFNNEMSYYIIIFVCLLALVIFARIMGHNPVFTITIQSNNQPENSSD